MTTVSRGGTIDPALSAVFRDGALNPVDPITPLISIYDPANALIVGPTAPVRDSVGYYHFPYTLSITAALGNWRAYWTGTINGVLVEGEEIFTVVAAGSVIVPQPPAGYADVLTREEAWFQADLSTRGVAPLLATSGGPFHVVAANPRRLSQGRNQMWLVSATSRLGKAAKDLRRWDHDVVAMVLWTAKQSSVRAQDDEVALAAAVQRVAERVAGPVGDRSHDGRWFTVGDIVATPASPFQVLTFADVIGGLGAAYVVLVSWRVSEYVSV